MFDNRRDARSLSCAAQHRVRLSPHRGHDEAWPSGRHRVKINFKIGSQPERCSRLECAVWRPPPNCGGLFAEDRAATDLAPSDGRIRMLPP